MQYLNAPRIPHIKQPHCDYLQVTDEHWRRVVTGETKHGKNVAESTAVPSGLGMNRTAQRFRKESVTVERAMRNTHMHKQVGVTRWARQDSTSWIAVAIQDAESCLGILRTLDKRRAFRSFLV